jgi:hypothetical protein
MHIDDATMSNVFAASCLIELERYENGSAEFRPLCLHQDWHDIALRMRFLPFEEWWEKDTISFESETQDPLLLIDVRPPLPRRPPLPPLPRGIPPAIAAKLVDAVMHGREPTVPTQGWLTRITRKQLVPLHRGFDELPVAGAEGR